VKAIAVLAYNRPDYLHRTLTALSACRGIEDYTVVVSVDDGQHQKETAKVARSFPCVNVKLLHYRRLGVDEHPRWLYDVLFRNHDFIVAIEDDVVPSPDALELCDWFHDLPEQSQYACLCLHSHSRCPDHPLMVREHMRFSPWGWAFTRDTWNKYLLPEWNLKPETPHGGVGWDWSVNLTIQRHGLKVLYPSLSRTLNIGRERGTYENPVSWDEWTRGLIASDGTYGNRYRIASHLPPGYEQDVDCWVKEVLDAEADC